MCYIKWRKPNAVEFAIGFIYIACITFLLGIIVMSENKEIKNRRDKAERAEAKAKAEAEAEVEAKVEAIIKQRVDGEFMDLRRQHR